MVYPYETNFLWRLAIAIPNTTLRSISVILHFCSNDITIRPITTAVARERAASLQNILTPLGRVMSTMIYSHAVYAFMVCVLADVSPPRLSRPSLRVWLLFVTMKKFDYALNIDYLCRWPDWFLTSDCRVNTGTTRPRFLTSDCRVHIETTRPRFLTSDCRVHIGTTRPPFLTSDCRVNTKLR